MLLCCRVVVLFCVVGVWCVCLFVSRFLCLFVLLAWLCLCFAVSLNLKLNQITKQPFFVKQASEATSTLATPATQQHYNNHIEKHIIPQMQQ